MRSRSEFAVISCAPSRPSARIAVSWPRTRPWVAAKSSVDARVQRADDDIGEPREQFAGLLRRNRAGQDARADQKHVLLPELPAQHRAHPRSSCVSPSLRDSSSASRSASGKAPKKLGSISGSMTWGVCAKMSASRGATPRIKARKRTARDAAAAAKRKRQPVRSPARKRSNATNAASGRFGLRELDRRSPAPSR